MAWQAAAAELGLEITASYRERSLEGSLRGVPVRADWKRDVQSTGKAAAAHEATRFRAGGDGKVPHSLSLRKGSPLLTIVRLVEGTDVPIGDDTFDELAQLSRVDAYVCAALSFSARYRLRAWLELGGEVSEGVVS